MRTRHSTTGPTGARSPPSSCRWARTASSRWWLATRSSPSSVSSSSSPASGPSTIATATAWLSVTIGFGDRRSSSRYSARICGQSVSSARSASACTAAIAAWSWYGPGVARASAPDTSATPSSMDARSHSPRSCSASGTSVPSGPRARRPPRVGQQHQREQARDLAVVGQQRVDRAGEADRLPRQLRALELRAGRRGVALAEDQVEHVQHGGEALRALLLGGRAEGDAGRLDPLLRAADALRLRRLGDEERAGDLRRGEAADRAQRERDLRRRREGGVAAEEQQRQRVVLLLGERLLVGRRRDRLVCGHLHGGGVLPPPARLLAAQLVGQPPRGHGDEPCARVLRHAVVGPLDGGGEQRLLDGVLGGVEPPGAADEDAEDLRREAAQQVLDARARRHISVPDWPISGRSSTAA